MKTTNKPWRNIARIIPKHEIVRLHQRGRDVATIAIALRVPCSQVRHVLEQKGLA